MNEEDYICPITLALLEDPIQVPCCGMSFSRISLIQVFKLGQHQCPNCRKDLHDFDPINAPKNIIVNRILTMIKEKQEIDTNNQQSIENSRNTNALPIISNNENAQVAILGSAQLHPSQQQQIINSRLIANKNLTQLQQPQLQQIQTNISTIQNRITNLYHQTRSPHHENKGGTESTQFKLAQQTSQDKQLELLQLQLLFKQLLQQLPQQEKHHQIQIYLLNILKHLINCERDCDTKFKAVDWNRPPELWNQNDRVNQQQREHFNYMQRIDQHNIQCSKQQIDELQREYQHILQFLPTCEQQQVEQLRQRLKSLQQQLEEPYQKLRQLNSQPIHAGTDNNSVIMMLNEQIKTIMNQQKQLCL